MVAPDGFGQEWGNGEDLHVGQALIFCDRHGVGGDDLLNFCAVPQMFNGFAGEEAVGTGHEDASDIMFTQVLKDLDDRSAIGDLVVKDDDIFSVDFADDILDDYFVVGDTLFAACCDRHTKHTRKD